MTNHTELNVQAMTDGQLTAAQSMLTSALAKRLTKADRAKTRLGLDDVEAELARRSKRTITSHAACDHPSTKAARSACRRERPKPLPPPDTTPTREPRNGGASWRTDRRFTGMS
jgi:hypothetical protein